VAYQKRSLDDAVQRAEHEALKYLTSASGDLWLTLASYSKAEEVMNERLADRAVDHREHSIQRKKLVLIDKYTARIRRLQAVLDVKMRELQVVADGYRLELTTARAGYMSKRLHSKIEAVTTEMDRLPEHALIISLNKECEDACIHLEESLMGDYDDYNNDSGAEDGEKDGEVNGKIGKWRRHHAPSAADENLMDRVREELNTFVKGTVGLVGRGELAFKQMERSIRIAMDIADMRVRKVAMIARGDFSEVQRELKHDMFSQYVAHAVAVVRRQTEANFRNTDRVREALQGRDIQIMFDEWKRWVRTKQRRVRRDMRMECRRAVRGFEAGMESINIVEELLEDWVQLEDLYTERPFWKNLKTGQIAMERPGYEHYLPMTFQVPTPPEELPTGISLETSSDDDDELNKTTKTKNAPRKPKFEDNEEDDDEGRGGNNAGREGITIDGEIHVSDSDSDKSSRAPSIRRDEGEPSPFTTKNLRGHQTDRVGLGQQTFNTSSNTIPTVTTARTGVFGGSFAFASPFKKYQGGSFVNNSFYSLDEHGSNNGSFYGLHVPPMAGASTGDLNQLFKYGPDTLRCQKGLYLKKEMELVDSELLAMKDGEEGEDLDPKVQEMRVRIDEARAFKQTKEYQYLSALKGGELVVGQAPTLEVISEVKQYTLATAFTETAIAERATLKVFNIHPSAAISMLNVHARRYKIVLLQLDTKRIWDKKHVVGGRMRS
jgi:hypothetical protein